MTKELGWIEQTDTDWLVHMDDGYVERYTKTRSIYPVEKGKPMFDTVKPEGRGSQERNKAK